MAAGGAIRYLGALEGVPGLLNKAGVFVLPTYYREGVPRTILEALACGLPVITTDTPGCRDTVIEGENGVLVPPRDSRALAGSRRPRIFAEGTSRKGRGRNRLKVCRRIGRRGRTGFALTHAISFGERARRMRQARVSQARRRVRCFVAVG